MAAFDENLVNIVGDIMISAGALAYLGSFTVSGDDGSDSMTLSTQ